MTGDKAIRWSQARLLSLLVLVGALAVLGGGGSASAGSQAANGRIAYVSDGACRFDPAERNEDILSMAPDGTGKADLSRNANPDGAPAWSPDGTRLAFTRAGKGSNDDVFVMNANGKAQRNLTKTSPDDANPDWTADGSKVTYDVGGSQIFSSTALRRAGCAAGTVKYARSKRPRGSVMRQTPRKVSVCASACA